VLDQTYKKSIKKGSHAEFNIFMIIKIMYNISKNWKSYNI